MNKNIPITFFAAMLFCFSYGQNINSDISSGNKLYQQKIYDQSAAEYKKAIAVSPQNPVANYNLGNALFRTNKYDEASVFYESAIANSKEKPAREKAFYNKGVSFSKQQKLDESIDAWKNALKLDATDADARENLQKALLEKKKQQQKEDEKKDKNDKKKDKQDQDKKKKQDQKPEEQQSKLNKKQVEQLLKALAQKEKEVQQKMQAKNASPTTLDKDW